MNGLHHTGSIDYRQWSMNISRDDAATWAGWFKALGDPTRILILHLLVTESRPMNVGEIVDALDVGQSTISHHLQILGETCFVHVERVGQLELVADQRTVPGLLPERRRADHGPSPTDRSLGRHRRGLRPERSVLMIPRRTGPGLARTADPAIGCVGDRGRRRRWWWRVQRVDVMTEEQMMDEAGELEEVVRRYYAGAAVTAAGGSTACCGPQAEQFGAGLYDDLDGLPDAAALASIGCGNPVAVADLQPGEVVLDLGSGGGIDVLLSARRVAPERLGVRGRLHGRDARPRPPQRVGGWGGQCRVPRRPDRRRPTP